MNQQHTRKIHTVAAQVKHLYESKTPFKIYHGSTNSTRILDFKKSEMLDVSQFNKVLSIDTHTLTAIVEPNVPMDKLVAATLKHGLVPPVIPEFPGITVGGGIQGGAGESSSFKWGFLSDTVNWIEYILADGTILKCSPTEHSDLFYGASGSCGSLGVITAVEIQLIPAKKYVHLRYQPVDGFETAVQKLTDESQRENDFVDGIMFGNDHGVVITGTLSDQKIGRVQKFSRAHDPWYYLHAQNIDSAGKPHEESVPLKDYLFRYNRGAFWVGRYAFDLFNVRFTAFNRFILNPILNTRKLYQALQVSGASQEYIVQDLTLPLAQSVDYMHYIDTATGIYPLWLCPVKPEPRSPLSCHGIENTPIAMNVGVWGPRIEDPVTFKKLNRDIEKKLADHAGKKWMYAHTYYTEDEFWRIYDKAWYDTLRTTYHADFLPSIYEKVAVKKHYAINTRRGVWQTIFGTAKLRIEK